MKKTRMFKLPFGLDKYSGLHCNCRLIQIHHCQLKIDEDGKQVTRYVQVTGSCTDPVLAAAIMSSVIYGTGVWAYYWPNGWPWTFCLPSILSFSAGDDVGDVSCKYWVITIRIDLPKICLLRLGLSCILLVLVLLLLFMRIGFL